MLDGKNMPNLAIGENVALKVLHKLVHSNLWLVPSQIDGSSGSTWDRTQPTGESSKPVFPLCCSGKYCFP